MKHPLPQRPLRFATAQAYDLPLRAPGSFRVERSAEQFSLDEPIGASHGHDSTADADAQTAEITERPFIDRKTGAVCTNPLREEPSPLAVGAVKRFGLVGLVGVAVGAGIARWWNSFASRDH
jgi:hypothetical protein